MSERTRPERRTGRIESRLSAAMIHVPRYSGRGRKRLAADSGVPKTTLRRLLKGYCNPSFQVVCRIVAAIERQTGKRIDPREVFAEGGAFRSEHICQAMDCPGCLPPQAHDKQNERTLEFEGVEPGTWRTSRVSDGFQPIEEVE